MASHRAVANGMVYEVEAGEQVKPRGADEVELLKCGESTGPVGLGLRAVDH